MKHLLLITVAVIIATISYSQAKDAMFGQFGISIVNKLPVGSADAGVKFGNNKLSFNIQTYNRHGANKDLLYKWSEHLPDRIGRIADKYIDNYSPDNPNRSWAYSLKYARIIPLSRRISIDPTITGGVLGNNKNSFGEPVFSGGFQTSFQFGWFGLGIYTMVPYLEDKNDKWVFPGVQTGVAFNVSIF